MLFEALKILGIVIGALIVLFGIGVIGLLGVGMMLIAVSQDVIDYYLQEKEAFLKRLGEADLKDYVGSGHVQ